MIYCGELKNSGLVFHAFYDKNTKRVRFYYNGREVENDYLYHMYNEPKYCLRGYSRLVTLLVTLGIITTAIGATAVQNNVDIDDLFHNYTSESVIDENFEPLSGEELYNELISRNPDISEYIEMTKDVVLEYGEYMDQEQILRTIDDLKIVKASGKEEFKSGMALAFYTKDENKIYLDKQVSEDYLIKTCLYHELLHYYSQSGLYDYNTYGDGYTGYALNEGMTELLNSELNDDEIFTYHKEAAYVGALCEIVGPEVFKKAYFGNNIEILIDELAKYSSEDEAIALIKTIDIAKDSYDAFVYYGYDEDYDNFVSANINAWDIISEMYENKYDRDMNEDNLMLAYKTATTLQNYSNIDLVGDSSELLVDVVVNKHYFYKEDNVFIVVDYNYANDNGIQGNSLIINETDRYIDYSAKKNKF